MIGRLIIGMLLQTTTDNLIEHAIAASQEERLLDHAIAETPEQEEIIHKARLQIAAIHRALDDEIWYRHSTLSGQDYGQITVSNE